MRRAGVPHHSLQPVRLAAAPQATGGQGAVGAGARASGLTEAIFSSCAMCRRRTGGSARSISQGSMRDASQRSPPKPRPTRRHPCTSPGRLTSAMVRTGSVSRRSGAFHFGLARGLRRAAAPARGAPRPGTSASSGSTSRHAHPCAGRRKMDRSQFLSASGMWNPFATLRSIMPIQHRVTMVEGKRMNGGGTRFPCTQAVPAPAACAR